MVYYTLNQKLSWTDNILPLKHGKSYENVNVYSAKRVRTIGILYAQSRAQLNW